MKLLLDENLSPRLVELLADVYPGTVHVQDVGLSTSSDAFVWAHAKAGGFTIVTKDSDFADTVVLEGAPPKVIWIRLGNCSTNSLAMLLRNRVQGVHRFLDGEEACLVLGKR